jgi:hypothetical protein
MLRWINEGRNTPVTTVRWPDVDYRNRLQHRVLMMLQQLIAIFRLRYLRMHWQGRESVILRRARQPI